MPANTNIRVKAVFHDRFEGYGEVHCITCQTYVNGNKCASWAEWELLRDNFKVLHPGYESPLDVLYIERDRRYRVYDTATKSLGWPRQSCTLLWHQVEKIDEAIDKQN